MGRVSLAKERQVAKKPQKRVKHIPQRTCIACRTVLAKKELVRVVRSPEGVVVDPTGKVTGRGAYIHNTRACWEKALRGPINQALRTEMTAEEKEKLQQYLRQQFQSDALDLTREDPGETREQEARS